ncbi:MAG: hypothetical protein K0Q73_4233, partial [Paenibacillus sp.]|nr:hypothetical protein [Paenibacillus sp.]
KITDKQNPYFDIACEQLISASKYYEKGVILQKKELSNHPYPRIIDSYFDGNVNINKEILPNLQEITLFGEIINYLLQNHDSDSYLNKNEILLLLDFLKNLVNEHTKFKVTFAEDIHKIHDRIISRNYTFNLTDIKSSVAQNLFVYLLKQDKLEEIEIILKENNLKNAYLTYSLLGVTTGFSSLSRIITNSAVNNKKLLDEIEKQVIQIHDQVWRKAYNKDAFISKSSDDSLYGSELITTSVITDKERHIELKIVDKIQKIREAKILRRFKNKKSINLKNDVTVIFEEIEDDMFIHFSKHGLNYLYILLRSKNNISIPEEQDNFKDSLRRLGYEKGNISRIAQGNYPIFFCFKVNGSKDDPLSIEDKENLLDYLDFLIEK